MPAHTTNDKNILRISFPVFGEGDKGEYISEIVCFLRMSDAGLETYYSHHIIRTRDSNVGPYTKEAVRRLSLTPALRAVIEQSVMHEFWSTFSRTLRTSPAAIDQLPTEINESDLNSMEPI